jgi:hypothetical protein
VLLEQRPLHDLPFGQSIHVLKRTAARHQVQIGLNGCEDAFSNRGIDKQWMTLCRLVPQSAGRVALGVEVDDQGLIRGFCHGPSQIDGCRGLANATFLVRYANVGMLN